MKKEDLRIIFMGTPEFAVETLQQLVENGYPVGLLAPQYEQAAAMFLQQLDNYGYAEENDDGEIILASRINSSKKTVLIQDGKYDFEEGEE